MVGMDEKSIYGDWRFVISASFQFEISIPFDFSDDCRC